MSKYPARRLVRTALTLPWLVALLLAAMPGCGTRTDVPRSPGDIRGYLGAPPNLAHVDPSPLRGRRILLDAGHGGFFRGAVGRDGLTEAEINLGVALYLQGMLQWAGAEVHMTRTADVDFLSPADSSLTADLAARVAICDSLQPDVFISIHHNSTADRDPTINETQTYYPLGRDGADLDLARAIHRQLVLALDIEPARILPGNFYVLRHAPVPAVLGEPAMLSNPVIEGRLGLARSLELEAAAYFLGLRDYFAGGTPRWLTSLPDTIGMAAMTEPLTWIFDAGSPFAPGLDPATLSLTVDGQPLPIHLDPAANAVQLLPRSLQTGTRLELTARNLAGRATPERAHVLDRRRSGPWTTLCILEAAGRSPRRALFTYWNEGQDLRDCGELRLLNVTDSTVTAAQTGEIAAAAAAAAVGLPVFSGQRGWLLLDLCDLGDSAVDRLRNWRVLERHADGRWFAHAESGPRIQTLPRDRRWLTLMCDAAVWPHGNVPGRGWRRRLPAAGGEGETAAIAQILDPLWPIVPHAEDKPLWLEADGARPLLLEAGGMRASVSDIEAEADATVDTLAWQPLLPALIGVRVVLDARGGGAEEQGRGPLGTRGSDLNLSVARQLAALLRGSGCEVLLMRDDDAWLPDPERVRRADLFGADLYMAIGRGAEPSVRHHHGSRVGRPWAAFCGASLARLLGSEVPVAAAYDYILRHTSCPAITVHLEAPTSARIEDRLNSPAWQNAVARALLTGTAALFQPDADLLDIGRMLADLGERAIAQQRLSYARLDGNLQWLPPGRAETNSLESWQDQDPGLPGLGGRHFLELRSGPQWQLWLLTRGIEGSWHGQLQLEGR